MDGPRPHHTGSTSQTSHPQATGPRGGRLRCCRRLRKSLQIVKGRTPLASPQQVVQAVPELFPQAPIPQWQPAGPPQVADDTAFADAARWALLHSPRRSGAGPDGMRYEHLRALLLVDPTNDDLPYLLKHYLQGTLPPSVCQAFGSGSLIPLHKASGTGVRPPGRRDGPP